MVKETVTYTDYNGESATEECFFNLTKAELLAWQAEDGGLTDRITTMTQEKDPNAILLLLTDVIRRAYGNKSENGKRFVKRTDASEDFIHSECFSELYMTFLTDPDHFAAFIEQLVPNQDKDIQ